MKPKPYIPPFTASYERGFKAGASIRYCISFAVHVKENFDFFSFSKYVKFEPGNPMKIAIPHNLVNQSPRLKPGEMLGLTVEKGAVFLDKLVF